MSELKLSREEQELLVRAFNAFFNEGFGGDGEAKMADLICEKVGVDKEKHPGSYYTDGDKNE